ncbi:PaaI family thioesterase [soil metagenome]
MPEEPTFEAEQFTKTLTWHDPTPSFKLALSMSGLDYLTEMAEGRIPPPPIGAHIGLGFSSLAVGDVVMTAVPDASHYNPIGTVHGGFIATILDSAAGCAVHTTLPAGVGYTSIDLRVNYFRAVHAGAPIVAHGWVVKAGSRVAYAEADLHDDEGKLLAKATSSCLIIQP